MIGTALALLTWLRAQLVGRRGSEWVLKER